MTEILVGILVGFWKSEVSQITTIEHLGKMDIVGKIIDVESGGLNDSHGSMGYVRFRNDQEEQLEISDKKFSSGTTTYDMTSELTAVFMVKSEEIDKCKLALMNAIIRPDICPALNQLGVSGINTCRTELVNVTTNASYIMQEEYPEVDIENKPIRQDYGLIKIDFDLICRLSGTVCFNQECDEC